MIVFYWFSHKKILHILSGTYSRKELNSNTLARLLDFVMTNLGLI